MKSICCIIFLVVAALAGTGASASPSANVTAPTAGTGAMNVQQALVSHIWLVQPYRIPPLRAQFFPDGSAVVLDKGWHWRWVATGPNTFVFNGDTACEFNGTFDHFDGIANHKPGKKTTGIQQEPVDHPGGAAPVSTPVPPVAPAATPAPPAESAASTRTYKTRIDELIDRKNVIVDDLFGPLDREMPASIREYLADLRENLLDEEARDPVASQQAYNLGSRFCNGLIGAFDERDKLAARLRNNAPTGAAGAPTTTKLRPKWLDYLRERDEAAAATHNNTIETPFARANILEWKTRGLQLRGNLDALYAQFRAAARQPVTPPKLR